jgi:hypothetical protein
MNTSLTDHELAELQADVQAMRDGAGQLTIDPIHAGQPIVEIYSYDAGESTYWLQTTHQGMPIFSCCVCMRVTLGKPGRPGEYTKPVGCAKCGTDYGDDLTPHLYDNRVACRSWSATDGGQYDGPCLIAGSDGCDCTEVNS